MKTYSLPNFTWSDDLIAKELIEIIKQNKLLIGTSDTVIGLIAPLSQTGFDLLNAAKGRSDKPYIILIDSAAMAKRFATYTIQTEIIMNKCWPGPLTLLVPAKSTLAPYLKSSENICALRVPDHGPLRNLARVTGGIFSTSANKTGKPVPHTFGEVDVDILNYVGGIVKDRGDQQVINHAELSIIPSTILDCTKEVPLVIREGAFKIEKIEQLSGISLQRAL